MWCCRRSLCSLRYYRCMSQLPCRTAALNDRRRSVCIPCHICQQDSLCCMLFPATQECSCSIPRRGHKLHYLDTGTCSHTASPKSLLCTLCCSWPQSIQRHSYMNHLKGNSFHGYCMRTKTDTRSPTALVDTRCRSSRRSSRLDKTGRLQTARGACNDTQLAHY